MALGCEVVIPACCDGFESSVSGASSSCGPAKRERNREMRTRPLDLSATLAFLLYLNGPFGSSG